MGIFTQSGGTHTINTYSDGLGGYSGGFLALGVCSDASGSYNLSGGSLAADNEIIGNSGSGTFTQNGGTHSVSGSMTFGDGGGVGAYYLNNGSLSVGTMVLNDGDTFRQTGGTFDAGTIDQSGGTATYTTLNMGRYSGSTGNYNLSGGTVSAANVIIGDSGSGAFTQSGGTHTVTGSGSLILGSSSTGVGRYNLSNGFLTAPTEIIGDAGLGSFIQSGGTNLISAANTLILGNSAGGSGSYDLSGGSLAAENEIIGNSGRGSFTQTGGTNTVTGALTLAVARDSQGSYNLQGGVLAAGSVTVGSGGTFTQTGGTAIGNLVNNGIFQYYDGIFNGKLSNYGTANIDGDFTPAGSFEQLAVAALVIYPGHTFNFGGSTLNNPSTGSITNNGTFIGNIDNYGYLGGTGISMGNLNNYGTFNPGNSPGTYTITNGNFNNTGTHLVEIASATNYDKVVVTNGAAYLGGTLQPVLLGGYLPALNQIFTKIVTATNGVIGTYNTIAASPTLTWRVLYNADSVDLQVVGDYANRQLYLTPNQQSVANVLQGLSTGLTSGDLWNVLNVIGTLQTNQQVQMAYNEISLMKYAGLPNQTLGLTRMQFEGLKNRLARRRWEAELASGGIINARGGMFGGLLNFNYENKTLMASTNLIASDAGQLSVRQNLEQRWGVYLEPLVNWGNLSGNSNYAGYRSVSAGFAAGVECRLRENLLVGLNTGYYHTDSNISGTGGNININTIPINLYASYFTKGFYVNGLLGYTYNGYDMSRNLAFSTINRVAKAGTDGNQFQSGVEAGYDLKAGNAILGPTLSLQYTTLKTGAFAENGAGSLNLAVDSQNASSLQTGLGVRASYRARIGHTLVKPQASIVWQHEYADNSRGLNARLATMGGGNMTFHTGYLPGRDFAVVNAELAARFSPRFVGHIGYTGELGRKNSSNQALNLGIRFEF